MSQPDLDRCPTCQKELDPIQKIFSYTIKKPKPCSFDCEAIYLTKLAKEASEKSSTPKK